LIDEVRHTPAALTNSPNCAAPLVVGRRPTGTTNERKLQLMQKKSKVVAVIAVVPNNPAT